MNSILQADFLNNGSDLRNDLHLKIMSLPSDNHERRLDAQFKWVGIMEAYHLLNLKASSLIDIGCGISPLPYYFKQSVETVYGIDCDKNVDWNKQKNAGITIINEDILSVDTIKSNSIDVVIDSCAIGCSMNVPLVIEKISKLLKSGGYFISVSDTDLKKDTIPFINPSTWIEICKKSSLNLVGEFDLSNSNPFLQDNPCHIVRLVFQKAL